MSRPDFGTHTIDHDGLTLACKYVAPGLTFQDLGRIFQEAKAKAAPSDYLMGNPALWPDNRGLHAVIEAMLDAIYPAIHKDPEVCIVHEGETLCVAGGPCFNLECRRLGCIIERENEQRGGEK